MRKKIFRSILLVALAVLLGGLVLFFGVLYNYFATVQVEQLKNELTLAAHAVEKSGLDYLDHVEPNNTRLTWVDEDGTVLFDSDVDAKTMENHKDREEIHEALLGGVGESSRYSTTLMQETLYYARRLDDHSVLRISISRKTTLALCLAIIQPLLLVLLLAVLLSWLLAGRLSTRIVEPLNELDLDKPLENEAYDELSPILTRLEQQHRKIREQSQELQDRRSEFLAITKNMNEGLILLNDSGTILSMNAAAGRFFHNNGDHTGEDFLTQERDYNITQAIDTTKAEGRAELNVERNGHVYDLLWTRVPVQKDEGGMVLLIVDITDKVYAERNRREFTANVSHELKTPLQSILGCAELMENGMVKQEDVPTFVHRIKSESERLVHLIEDIIRLSQLDENAPMQIEPVDVLDLAQDEIEALKNAADAMHVKLELEGEHIRIDTVRPLLHEVLYNLIDNAIKYNRQDGNVTITVARNQDNVTVAVQDTGIGIPEEDQDRIFERFYRVDKSHSRKIGGTGLGLSIVKHALSVLHGTIQVDSILQKGTTITITLPIERQ